MTNRLPWWRLAEASLLGAVLLAATVPVQAQVVQFLGVPTVDEVLEVLTDKPANLAPVQGLRSMPATQTVRIIRDEPVLTSPPTAGSGTAAPTPGAEATAGSGLAATAARPRPPRQRPTIATAFAFSDNFALGSTRLPPRTVALLDNTAEAMRRATDISILISGHTDATGNAVGNAVLSLSRAETAAQHLLLQGIEPSRVVVAGMGSLQPLPGVQPTASDNRRIQIAVTSRSDRP